MVQTVQQCRRRLGERAALAAGLLLASIALSTAGNPSNNTCEAGEKPDVIVGDLQAERRWGSVGSITAFSVGTYSCNVGDCWLKWIDDTAEHPVIGGNMYRLKDDRFEQLGQSWLKHGYFALSFELCESGCLGTDGTHLGVNCADPYSANLNGDQDRLGPKFEINASNGIYSFPPTDGSQTGNDIYKRLQVKDSDLDPALNPGAQYFVEAQYVTPDDAAAGNQDNNASWRPITVFEINGNSGEFDINMQGFTHQMEPAIFAWKLVDPQVRLDLVDVGPDDGVYWIGSKTTDLGGGVWRYEYAIQNLNSHRSAREFKVPIVPGASVQNVGFHDVDYHSGEPYSSSDWPWVAGPGPDADEIRWSTETFAQNPDANALRWGTLYNYRFETDSPPTVGPATLGLFRPGAVSEIGVTTQVPVLCDHDSICDSFETICDCQTDCTPAATELDCTDALDDDCDGFTDCFDSECCGPGLETCLDFDQDADLVGICTDCDDGDQQVWSTPTEVGGVHWQQDGSDQVLHWNPPADGGAQEFEYRVPRSKNFDDFLGVVCLVPFGATATTELVENEVPPLDSGYYYLVRAQNDCPVGGAGSVGTSSAGEPREADCL